jgi:hypothetical protein
LPGPTAECGLTDWCLNVLQIQFDCTIINPGNQQEGKSRAKKRNFAPISMITKIYVQTLVDQPDRDELYKNKMSKTDAVKPAMARACKRILPDIKFIQKRKRHTQLDF